MGKSILITGASGFIGSFIVERALAEGYDVWAGVRSTSSREYLSDARLHFIELNFSDREKLASQLEEHKLKHGSWDIVVHNAGVTKCRNRHDFMKVNYVQTRNFADALVQSKNTPSQFIYMSTLGVFGAQHEKDGKAISLSDPYMPNTEYGRSKCEAEKYLRSLPSFPYVIVRPTGVYGPREKDYFLMAESIKRHVDFAAGMGRQYLTFVYVQDLVNLIFLAIDKGVTGVAYNVSDGETYPSERFSELLKKELGNPRVMRFVCPLPLLKVISVIAQTCAGLVGRTSTLNADKYNIMKQRNWRCDISAAREELGYRPEWPLDRGVKATVQWYKEHKWL